MVKLGRQNQEEVSSHNWGLYQPSKGGRILGDVSNPDAYKKEGQDIKKEP